MSSIPSFVLAAYQLEDATIEHIPSLINSTFVVRRTPEGSAVVVQKLHPVFGPRVNDDIEAMTQYLASRNFETPMLVRTADDELWVEGMEEGKQSIWRAQTFINGITYHRECSLAAVESAAELLAQFHSVTHDFDYQFVHSRPLHNTPERLAQLREALTSQAGRGDVEAQQLGSEILRQAETIRVDYSNLPERIVHGDPKISNLLFGPDNPDQARCLIDLDTIGRGYLAYELGDALRSWTNPAGEDVAKAQVQVELFEASLKGYRKGKHSSVTEAEISSFVDGLETVSLELASRYATDVVVNEYWGWNSQRFASRREHNLLRARGQLALCRDVSAKRAQLEAFAGSD